MPIFDPEQDAHLQSWETGRVQNYTLVINNWKTSELHEMSIYGIGQCKTVFPERDNQGEGTLQSPTCLHPHLHPPAINKSNSGLCPPSSSQGWQTPDTFSVFLQDEPTSSCQPSLRSWELRPDLAMHRADVPPSTGHLPPGVQTRWLKKQQVTARLPCCESRTQQMPPPPH